MYWWGGDRVHAARVGGHRLSVIAWHATIARIDTILSGRAVIALVGIRSEYKRRRGSRALPRTNAYRDLGRKGAGASGRSTQRADRGSDELLAAAPVLPPPDCGRPTEPRGYAF
jgi:hypothetical protein